MSLRARLEQNLDHVLERIARARTKPSARLVAVTKSVPPAVALELVALGVTDLGESRGQEFGRKQAAFEAAGVDVRWHFIGHLQRNKARAVVAHADVLHSVDSQRLLETIARLAKELGRSPELFLQVKLNDEAAKGGFEPEAVAAALETARDAGLRVRGLMAMAPLVDPASGAEPARDTFRRLRALGDSLAASEPAGSFVDETVELSMGMSGDFELALAEGADLVRVGSALFEGLSPEEREPRAGSDRPAEGAA